MSEEKWRDGELVPPVKFCGRGNVCETIDVGIFVFVRSGDKKGCCGNGGKEGNAGRDDCEREYADESDDSDGFTRSILGVFGPVLGVGGLGVCWGDDDWILGSNDSATLCVLWDEDVKEREDDGCGRCSR